MYYLFCFLLSAFLLNCAVDASVNPSSDHSLEHYVNSNGSWDTNSNPAEGQDNGLVLNPTHQEYFLDIFSSIKSNFSTAFKSIKGALGEFLRKIGDKYPTLFDRAPQGSIALESDGTPIGQPKGTLALIPITPAQKPVFDKFCIEIIAKYGNYKQASLALHPDKICTGAQNTPECNVTARAFFTRAYECFQEKTVAKEVSKADIDKICAQVAMTFINKRQFTQTVIDSGNQRVSKINQRFLDAFSELINKFGDVTTLVENYCFPKE